MNFINICSIVKTLMEVSGNISRLDKSFPAVAVAVVVVVL